MKQSAGLPRRGRFITLEGGEGAGKSTQVARIVAALEGMGVRTLATREPGGTPKAEALRAALLAGVVAPLGPTAEALAFSAARIDHLDRKIRPALAEGVWVVCDRFADSTRAYQGALGHLAPQLVRAMEAIVVGETRPDLTLMLDLDPEKGLARATARRGDNSVDRFEGQNLQFHRALRAAFLKIAVEEPERCAVIDAARSQNDVAAEIWREIEERLDPRSWRGPR
jgi:dTMP kinase